ncbi:hypothetical protein RDI58_000816 [Solanum bulbocastanum]
MIWPKKK